MHKNQLPNSTVVLFSKGPPKVVHAAKTATQKASYKYLMQRKVPSQNSFGITKAKNSI